MFAMLIRNLKLYFKDKASLFFSLLGAIIVVLLYVLFLGDTMTNGFSFLNNPTFLADSWVMAGIISISAVTTSMGGYAGMVDDRANRIERDFIASPIGRSSIVCSYLFNSLIISFIMATFTLVVAELFIVCRGGELLTLHQCLKMILIILLSSLSASSIIGFICSFLPSMQSFTLLSILFGSTIGFIVGCYVPIGSLSKTMQNIMTAFPCTHSASLLRQVMTEVPMEQVLNTLPSDAIAELSNELGILLKINNLVFTSSLSVCYLIATSVLFYVLTIINLKNKKEK